MYIDLIECGSCGKRGRPGQEGLTSQGDIVNCSCGNNFTVKDSIDQLILSSNKFCRLNGTSNHMDSGTVMIIPGETATVDFKTNIDFFCKAFLTPENYPIATKEVNVTKTGMTIICGKIPDVNYGHDKVKLNWLVFGLNNLQNLPTWYTQFYSAISNAENGLFKASLFDYAVSFEAFLEEFIRVKLAQRYDNELAEFLLSSNQRVEDRCKRILQLATGKKLTDRDDVYQPWDINVRRIRNKLFHGENILVTHQMTELAHSAVYQAIRFIERECI